MMNHLPRERKKSRLLAFPEPGFIVQKIAKDAAPAVTAPPVTIWKPEVGSAVNSQRLDNRFIFIAFLVGMATMSLPHLPLLAGGIKGGYACLISENYSRIEGRSRHKKRGVSKTPPYLYLFGMVQNTHTARQVQT